MRGSKQQLVTDFSPGLLSALETTDLPPGGASVALNVMPDSSGVRRRTPTTLKVASGASMLAAFYSPNLSGLYGYNATNAYNLETGASLGAHGLSSFARWAEAPISGGQGPLFLMDSATAKYVTGAAVGTWTASSGTLPLSPAGALAWHGNRMWVGGDPSRASRLWFSDPSDPRVWPALNYADIDPDMGAGITAVCPCGPYLLVFKKSRLYVVYDLQTGANRVLSTRLGASQTGLVAQGPYGTAYFVDTTGDVYFTDGSTITKVSGQLSRPFVTYGTPRWAAYSSGLLAVQYTSGNFLIYNEAQKSWWPVSFNAAAASSTTMRVTAGAPSPTPLFHISNDVDIHSWAEPLESVTPTSGADYDAHAFTSTWAGGDMNLGRPAARKRVRLTDIEGQGLPSFRWTRDKGTPDATKTLTFNSRHARVPTPGVGYTWRPEFVGGAGTTGWVVDAMTLGFEYRKN